MEYNLKCQLCGKQICVTPEAPCALGEHLLEHHPDVELTFFSCEEDGDSKSRTCCKCKPKRRKKIKKDVRQDIERERDFQVDVDGYEVSSHLSFRTLSRMSISNRRASTQSKKGIFKTTVETWKPGPVKVICPKCKRNDRPCIRKQRNRVAHSSLGAFLMLTCWPICFLPFLLPKGSTVDLFCKHCGTFLGEYNTATGTLKCACDKRDKKANDPRNICSDFD